MTHILIHVFSIIVLLYLCYIIYKQRNKIDTLEFLLKLEKDLKKMAVNKSDEWMSKYSRELLNSTHRKIERENK